jgi:hypothetical protein
MATCANRGLVTSFWCSIMVKHMFTRGGEGYAHILFPVLGFASGLMCRNSLIITA